MKCNIKFLLSMVVVICAIKLCASLYPYQCSHCEKHSKEYVDPEDEDEGETGYYWCKPKKEYSKTFCEDNYIEEGFCEADDHCVYMKAGDECTGFCGACCLWTGTSCEDHMDDYSKGCAAVIIQNKLKRKFRRKIR